MSACHKQQQINWSTTLIDRSKTSRSTIDLRRAEKYDGGHTTSRRQSLAGWLYAGGKISHMSTAERKRTLSFIHKGNAYASLPHTSAGKVICTGSDQIVKYSAHKHGPPNFRWYLNSCRTKKVLWTMDSIVVVSGAVAAFAGFSSDEVVAFWAAVLGVIVGAAKQYLQYQDDQSALPAIWPQGPLLPAVRRTAVR
ncbi:MAG: hypothetical protein ACRYG2_09565 [Janthinobacterium lividum]